MVSVQGVLYPDREGCFCRGEGSLSERLPLYGRHPTRMHSCILNSRPSEIKKVKRAELKSPRTYRVQQTLGYNFQCVNHINSKWFSYLVHEQRKADGFWLFCTNDTFIKVYFLLYSSKVSYKLVVDFYNKTPGLIKSAETN